MKQKLSFPMLSVLVVLSTSSSVFAAAPAASQKTNDSSKALAASKERANKNAKAGDFVDANGKAVGPQQAPQAKRESHPPQAVSRAARLAGTNKVATTVTDDSIGWKIPKTGAFQFNVTSKNTMTAGTRSELQEIDGKEYEMFNEILAGFRHDSGFGLDLTGSFSSESYADRGRNQNSNNDMSAILYHPSLYKGDIVSLGGRFRVFAPTSAASQAAGNRQYRYESILGFTLPAKFSITNFMSFRTYSKDKMTDKDRDTMIYHCLELAHQTTDMMALSLGEEIAYTNLRGGQTSTSMRIYPFIDFQVTKNILIEPKIYFPLMTNDPSQSYANLDNSQAELYVKLSI